MLKIICPKCEKDTLPVLFNVLPKRHYQIRCSRCRTNFVVNAEELDRQELANSPQDKSAK